MAKGQCRMGKGLCQFGVRIMGLVDKLRTWLLRKLLPKQQFYIQNNGFHSVFHPIMKPLLDRTEDIDAIGITDDNS